MGTVIVGGLDIETTGLKQEEGHRIIEVAVCLYALQTETLESRFVKSYTRRINPQRSIDPGAQAVHGISFEEVAMCPTWDVIAPELARVIEACGYLVAHNGAGFDMPFVGFELMRVGQPVPNKPCVDTMLEGRWATPSGKVPNLGELCFACGVEYDKGAAHAAEYDVQVMMSCYFAGLKGGFFSMPV